MNLTIEALNEKCKPTAPEDGNAGLDLRASEPVSISPNSFSVVKLGVKLAFPSTHVGLLYDRSGIAAKFGLFKTAGVIDSNYRGELMVVIHNPTRMAARFDEGDRICQIVFVETPKPDIKFGSVDESNRGESGFGSSGLQ